MDAMPERTSCSPERPVIFRTVSVLVARTIRACLIVLVLFGGRCSIAADEPTSPAAPPQGALHQRINLHLIATGAPTTTCTDAEFLRRVSLDLIGIPPRADEARAFITDAAADKRIRVVDQLMQSPLFGRHIATSLDVMLMERRANTNIPQDDWLNWLVASVREDKPWNVLVREILTADGNDPATRVAARFYLDRGSEPNVIARDIGRIFFGRDLQCAQCHDSPLVSDYLQADYHGLLAFTSPGYPVTRKIAEKDTVVYAERAASELSFESVFIKGTMHRTGARIPGGSLIDEPFFLPGDEYTVPPADAVRSVPKFSRRAVLAEHATSGANDLFNQNSANRFWALMLGRGIVHPLDMIHPDNPPANSRLLSELGEQFAAMKFDIRGLLREIIRSDAYQRSFDLPPAALDSSASVVDAVGRLTLELDQLAPTAAAAVAEFEAAATAYDAAEAAWLPIVVELDAARNKYAEARKKSDEAAKAAADAAAALAAKKSVADAVQLAAGSTAAAAASLPDDTELKAASDRLATRNSQLAAEVTALQAAADEKSKAGIAAVEAVAGISPDVEAARLKLEPLTTALREADRRKVSTRQASQIAQSAANSVSQQLTASRSSAALPTQKLALDRALAALPEQDVALAGVRHQMAQFAPVVAQRQSQLDAAQLTLTAAAKTATESRAQAELFVAAAGSLSESLAALRNAGTALPSDTELADSVARLSARSDQLGSAADSAKQAQESARTALADADAAVEAGRKLMLEATAESQRLQTTLTAAESARNEAVTRLAAEQRKLDECISDSSRELSDQFALYPLKPLTPEQMCWSIFRVTTVYDRYVVSEGIELDKTSPLSDEQKSDPAAVIARARDVEQKVYDKLKQYIPTYVQYYGGGPGQAQGEFYASPDQALHSANGGAINSWCAAAGDNAAERIVNQPDPKLCAEELYLAILTRLPTDEEKEEVALRLQAGTSRGLVAQELVWGLLNSAEFRFSH